VLGGAALSVRARGATAELHQSLDLSQHVHGPAVSLSVADEEPMASRPRPPLECRARAVQSLEGETWTHRG
jgi:hypothetical protein